MMITSAWQKGTSPRDYLAGEVVGVLANGLHGVVHQRRHLEPRPHRVAPLLPEAADDLGDVCQGDVGHGQHLDGGLVLAVLLPHLEGLAVARPHRPRQRHGLQGVQSGADEVLALLQGLGTRGADDAGLDPFARQPHVGVVLPQGEAVLGPRGEHAVRFVGPATDLHKRRIQEREGEREDVYVAHGRGVVRAWCATYVEGVNNHYPIPQSQIDLSDGVLVNYNKFGKAVKEVGGLNDSATKKKVKQFDWIDTTTII